MRKNDLTGKAAAEHARHADDIVESASMGSAPGSGASLSERMHGAQAKTLNKSLAKLTGSTNKVMGAINKELEALNKQKTKQAELEEQQLLLMRELAKLRKEKVSDKVIKAKEKKLSAVVERLDDMQATIEDLDSTIQSKMEEVEEQIEDAAMRANTRLGRELAKQAQKAEVERERREKAQFKEESKALAEIVAKQLQEVMAAEGDARGEEESAEFNKLKADLIVQAKALNDKDLRAYRAATAKIEAFNYKVSAKMERKLSAVADWTRQQQDFRREKLGVLGDSLESAADLFGLGGLVRMGRGGRRGFSGKSLGMGAANLLGVGGAVRGIGSAWKVGSAAASLMGRDKAPAVKTGGGFLSRMFRRGEGGSAAAPMGSTPLLSSGSNAAAEERAAIHADAEQGLLKRQVKALEGISKKKCLGGDGDSSSSLLGGKGLWGTLREFGKRFGKLFFRSIGKVAATIGGFVAGMGRKLWGTLRSFGTKFGGKLFGKLGAVLGPVAKGVTDFAKGAADKVKDLFGFGKKATDTGKIVGAGTAAAEAANAGKTLSTVGKVAKAAKSVAGGAAGLAVMGAQMAVGEDTTAGKVLNSNTVNGALIGGTVGSILPGIGTAIGAGVGGTVGLGMDAWEHRSVLTKKATSMYESATSMASSASDKAAGTYGSMKDAVGKLFKVKGSDVNVEGINPAVQANFNGMAAEYKQRGGKGDIQVNSGFRSREEQAALYAKDPKRAVPPGRSAHGTGLAIDINSREANQLDSMGLLAKYGFARPVKGEPWHLQAAGTATALAKVGATSADYQGDQTIKSASAGSRSGNAEPVTSAVPSAPPSVQSGPSSDAGNQTVSTASAAVPKGSATNIPNFSYMDSGFFILNLGAMA